MGFETSTTESEGFVTVNEVVFCKGLLYKIAFKSKETLK